METKDSKSMTSLKSIINNIRDILRAEGITGMDSINHCLIFILCRYMTPEMCEKLNIPTKFSFEKMSEIKSKSELFEKFYNSNSNYDSLYKNFVEKLQFKSMKWNQKNTENTFKIFQQLKKIDLDKFKLKYDIVGTIYELHLGTGTSSSMRDLGQYFTNRLVIDYMIKLTKPKLVDGEIETICDPTMGTGGFLTMAVKYLNDENKDIDWKSNKDRIYGFDINEHVKNLSSLNLLLEIGEFFGNLRQRDSLYQDLITEDNTHPLKFDIILANEPMGIKSLKHADCCDKIKKLKIRGTKAEPLFIQLFGESLNDGGRCAVIVPDGFLFGEGKLHTETRKYLIENFNLSKIISLNGKFFQNTNVATSILFFTKIGKTKTVEFSELKLNDNKLEENKILNVEYKNIVKNEYSLFINKFTKKEEKKSDVEHKKIKDICDFLSKSKRKASEGEETGKFNFYTSSNVIKKIDEADYKEECIIIGTGGNANVKYDKKFSCSSDNFIIKSKIPEQINLKYIYYYLFNNLEILKNGFSGTTIKHISKSYVENIEIPIINIELQDELVKKMDLIYSNIKTSQKNIEELKEIIKINFKLQLPQNSDKKSINELCEIKSGKFKSGDSQEEGKYPFYTGKANNPSGFYDEYCFDYHEYIILIKDGGAGKNKYGEQIGLGKSFKVKGRSASTSHQLAIIPKSKKITNDYLYIYLSVIKNEIMDLAKYTTGLGTIKKSDIEKIEINLPSIEKQNEIVKVYDEHQNLIDKLEKQSEFNYNLAKNLVNHYLNSKANNVKFLEDN